MEFVRILFFFKSLDSYKRFYLTTHLSTWLFTYPKQACQWASSLFSKSLSTGAWLGLYHDYFLSNVNLLRRMLWCEQSQGQEHN